MGIPLLRASGVNNADLYGVFGHYDIKILSLNLNLQALSSVLVNDLEECGLVADKFSVSRPKGAISDNDKQISDAKSIVR